jgi:hypothetical protein
MTMLLRVRIPRFTSWLPWMLAVVWVSCLPPVRHAKGAGASPYSKTPDWESQIGYCGTGLAFADINQDAFVFFNLGAAGNGRLEEQPGWLSDNKILSMDVAFGDVDKDGRIDLIQGDPSPMVYMGDDNGPVRTPGWQAAAPSYFSNQLDFAATLDLTNTDPKAHVSSLMVAANNYMGGGQGRFDLYRFDSSYIVDFPPRTSSPSWSSSRGGWGSAVLFADVDNDGKLDLLAGRWAAPASGILGAPVALYRGDGVRFSNTPVWVSETSSVIETLVVADLRNRGLQKKTAAFTPGDNASWSVLSLPAQNIENVLQITVDKKKLSSTAYAVVPGTNIVYLASPLKDRQTATVDYQISSVRDLGVTNWDCDKGNYLFYSKKI